MVNKMFFALLVFISVLNNDVFAQYSFKIEKRGTGKQVIFIPSLISSGEVWRETVQKL